jgi:hypothetical protein
LEATLWLRTHDMGAVSLFWQLFDMWNKKCQFLAKVFLRIFLVIPVTNPSNPAPCDHKSSGTPVCRVKTLLVVYYFFFFFANLWIQSFICTLPSPCPSMLFKWTRSTLFTNNKHTLFSWVHFCSTHNHSTLSQTPVWHSRLDVMGTVHFVEGCDGSASIDVSFVHTIFTRNHTKIKKLLRNVWVS